MELPANLQCKTCPRANSSAWCLERARTTQKPVVFPNPQSGRRTLSLVAEAWVSRPPLGLDLYLPVPITNPLTREKAALGRRLFFVKRLSPAGTLAEGSRQRPG